MISDAIKENGNLLCNAPVGIKLKITGLETGRASSARLTSMGIIPGETVEIIRKNNGGPILIEVKGTRVALGRGISTMIKISPIESSES